MLYELNESKNQADEIKMEFQTLKNQLDHSEFERQKLSDELKTKNTSQIIYIKNEEASNVLSNYNLYLEKYDEEKKQLLKQIQQFQLHDDKIKIENQKRLDKFSQALKNSEEKRKHLEEELLTYKQELQIYRNQSEEQITAQKQYEEERKVTEFKQKLLLDEKDKIIKEKEKIIHSMEERLKSSNSFVSDIVNMVIPQHLDDSLEIQKKNLNQEKELERLKKEMKELQNENTKKQSEIDNYLPYVIQRKKEYEQLISISQQQKIKLESEIHLNKQIRENIYKLETEVQQLKKKDEIQRTEIERLRQDSISCRQYIANVQNTDVQAYMKQLSEENLTLKSKIEQMQIIKVYNQQMYHAPAKQIEVLQQENMGLKMLVNKKDEDLLTLQERINILQQENELNEALKKPVDPIIHKIEKIKIKSQKQSQFQQDFRNLRREKQLLQFKLEELEFELQKLTGQIQFEKTQKDFLEKNLLRYKEEYGKARENFKKRQEEFEIKIQEISMEMQSKMVTQEQINYYQQNQLLYKQQQEDKKLIMELHNKIKQTNQDNTNLREELFFKQAQIKELEGRDQLNSENEQILKMKLQIENDKIIIQNLNERIKKLNQEGEQLQQELQTYIQDKNDRESLLQFTKFIANQNKSELNNLEEISDLKRSLENNTKRLEEQNKQYTQALENYKKEFEKRIEERNSIIQQLEEENKDLANALEQYRLLYFQEKQEKESKCDLSLGEMNDIQLKLDKMTKERDLLLRKKESYENREQQFKMIEESLKQQEKELDEQKQQFEQDSQKRQQEIAESLITKKNKELSILTNDYVLIRELDDYKTKLIQEQNKVNDIMMSQQQIQQPSQTNEQGEDANISEKQQLENQLNELQLSIEEKKAELLRLNIDQRMQIEEIPNLQEERQQFQQQITDLNQFKDGITLKDIKLVREVIQSGKLIAYLEKAKEMHQQYSVGQS